MLTLLAYLRYVERPDLGRYLVVGLVFLLALLSKPMAVTLPCVLLLLDYWPLGRMRNAERGASSGEHGTSTEDMFPSSPSFILSSFSIRLLAEKLPLFALSAVSSVITVVVQHRGGAVAPHEAFPCQIRLANAAVSYVVYMARMFYPQSLAVPYPHPAYSLTAGQVGGSILVLAVITVVALWYVRRYPYLFVGWFWFLGTLVPVIGILQVGGQAMADRYTYLPLIGLFLILAWGAADLAATHRLARVALAGIAGLAVVTLAGCAWFQTQYWRNSVALFEHALRVTRNNSVAHNNLGTALMQLGRFDEAALQFSKAIEVAPNNIDAWNNLGVSQLISGNPAEAAATFERVLQVTPEDATVHTNLGVAFLEQGQVEEARKHLLRAIELDPACDKARQALTRLP
jgi:hypothetical protein